MTDTATNAATKPLTEMTPEGLLLVEIAEELAKLRERLDALEADTCPFCGEVGALLVSAGYHVGPYICEECYETFAEVIEERLKVRRDWDAFRAANNQMSGLLERVSNRPAPPADQLCQHSTRGAGPCDALDNQPHTVDEHAEMVSLFARAVTQENA